MRTIRLRFCNGLTFADAVRDILFDLTSEFSFEESDSPHVIVFGPYGRDIPPPQEGVVRVGYFCENIVPDMSICDWAFGIPYEDDVRHPRYKRIDWHGVSPGALSKPQRTNRDVERILASKTGFCNFVYASSVPYRERFFRELIKYKHIDAPGRSMNNMPSIDRPGEDRWAVKREFLSRYKFTIAFENDSYPGYHTEKIIDPMLADTVPIYFGNPRIDEHFNERSFVNGHRYVRGTCEGAVRLARRHVRRSFAGAHPASIRRRAGEKGRALLRRAKMRLQCWDFSDLVEEVIRIDRDDALYTEYLTQPWFRHDAPASNEAAAARWRSIFDTALGAAP